jgi:dihydrofolate reductase
MRKLIVSEFLSLDGIMEDPGPDGPFKQAGWSMPYADGQFFKFKLDELFAADALLLGRVTYDGFAKAWPGRKDEAGFSERMNSIAKYVVSENLEKAEWNNSKIIRGDLTEEITKLKQQPGGNILVFGSSVLINALMQNNLIDEYCLLVYPLLLGAGKRLFEDGAGAKLKLLEAKSFDSGIVLLRYQVASGK